MIDANSIANEIRENVESQERESFAVEEILGSIVSEIKDVDFRELCQAPSDQRLTKTDYSVVLVDYLLNRQNLDICMVEGKIKIYNQRYWVPVDSKTFRCFLVDAAVAMGAPGTKIRHYSYADDMYKQFCLRVKNVECTREQVLMNLQNGTLEVTPNGPIVREFRKEDYLSHILPFCYEPSAECPMFDKMINRNLPDLDSQKMLFEYIGSIFVPNLKLEKVLMLYGSGANGKSVMFEIIRAMLGPENVCSYTLRSLTQREGYFRAELAGKLLNYASEINSSEVDSATFKTLASHEPVEARRPYCEAFTMTDYAKLLFNMNQLPDTKDLTDSFFRRLAIIPFNVRIPDEEQDPDLAAKIIEKELPGIFNLVVDGLKRVLRQRHLTDSKLAKDVIEEYRHDSDTIQQFLDMVGLKPGNDYKELASFLYNDYRSYARVVCNNIESLKSFSSALVNKGFKRVRQAKGAYIYYSKKDEQV